MLIQRQEFISILIVSAHATLRGGLQLLIERQQGMLVVGVAADGCGALALAKAERPDIVLLDFDSTGAGDGANLIGDLLAIAPGTRVIILARERNLTLYRQALTLGAVGLVFKDNGSRELLNAIQKVYAGAIWLDRALLASVLIG